MKVTRETIHVTNSFKRKGTIYISMQKEQEQRGKALWDTGHQKVCDSEPAIQVQCTSFPR